MRLARTHQRPIRDVSTCLNNVNTLYSLRISTYAWRISIEIHRVDYNVIHTEVRRYNGRPGGVVSSCQSTNNGFSGPILIVKRRSDSNGLITKKYMDCTSIYFFCNSQLFSCIIFRCKGIGIQYGYSNTLKFYSFNMKQKGAFI